MELTTFVRIGSQIALVVWCVAEALVSLAARGNRVPVVGVRWKLVGLAAFAAWMALSSVTIRDSAVFPREQLVAVFAGLELVTAVMAWAWLVVSVRQAFRFTFNIHTGGRTGGATSHRG